MVRRDRRVRAPRPRGDVALAARGASHEFAGHLAQRNTKNGSGDGIKSGGQKFAVLVGKAQGGAGSSNVAGADCARSSCRLQEPEQTSQNRLPSKLPWVTIAASAGAVGRICVGGHRNTLGEQLTWAQADTSDGSARWPSLWGLARR